MHDMQIPLRFIEDYCICLMKKMCPICLYFLRLGMYITLEQ